MTKTDPKNHFSVGILDDVTNNSLPFDANFTTEAADQVRALFWGLGADGTVSANKNSIKIIGEETPNYAQGYFVYDSKKSGAMTVSHLRFGPNPIQSTYLIQRANFIAVHQFNFLERYQVLDAAQEGATLLLNSPYEANEVWAQLPRSVQQSIIDKKIKVYSINAYAVAKQNQLGNRTNTIRPASSPSAALFHAMKQSSKLKTRSKRPTASGASRWCGRISRPSMRRLSTCTKLRCPRKQPALLSYHPPSPQTLLISSATSPAK